MAIIHEASKEVICKVVYHGAGMCGKTTSLMYLNHHLPRSQRGRFITLETPTERTLYFDFLPVITEARGYRFRYLLFTTPGQDYYEASRKLILKGADGLVLVVDSQRARLAENNAAMELLDKSLYELGQHPDLLPRVYQYNKRDLPDVIPLDEAERLFNSRHQISFPAVARTGQGVYETFLTVAKMALTKLTSAEGEARMGNLFKSTVITADEGMKFKLHLARLNEEAGAAASLLVDESSGVIASRGDLPGNDPETLGALLACNFTAAQELSYNISRLDFTGIQQRGAKWSINASRVDMRRFLVVINDGYGDARKIRNAMTFSRSVLAAQLHQVDYMSPSRLKRFGELFSSVGHIAISGMSGT